MRLLGYAGNALAVVADGTDRARHVGAVDLEIGKVVVVVVSVVAVNVVNHAVAVVVDSVTRNLAGVGPEVVHHRDGFRRYRYR